jgi:hypothetical protein
LTRPKVRGGFSLKIHPRLPKEEAGREELDVPQPSAPRHGHRAVRRASVAAVGIVTAGGLGAGLASAAPALRQTKTSLVHTGGVVIARDLRRHTLVVTSGGLARTLRVSTEQQLLANPLGTNVAGEATPLADGTYRIVRLTKKGRSTRATVRATIVKQLPHGLLLSGGGSVFALGAQPRNSAARGAHVAPLGPAPGEIVDATIEISSGSAQAASLQPLGQASLINLDGVLQSVSSSQLVVDVSDGALTTVTIPASITLPSTIAVGDEVEILASYSAGTFSLVTIVDDTLAGKTTGQGVTSPAEDGSSSVEVEGIVTSTSSTSIVVQPGDGAPVSLALPSQISAPPQGSRVHIVATMSGSTLTVVTLRVQVPESGDGGDGAGVNPGASAAGSDQHQGDNGQGISGQGGTLTATATTGDD